ADIRAALSAPQEGATGPDGPVYPGTCRDAAHTDPDAALRIDMRKAVARLDAPLTFGETDNPGGPSGPVTIPPVQLIEGVGDVILARKDIGTSYHLAVVVDDAEQGVTHVTRGQDLFEATAIHVLLQRLLGLPTPVYRHHRLIRDAAGKRLAKRDDARAIRTFRENGASPADIRRLAGL
ncbi:MAG: glutamate--tRNA ligase family protein, partial [Rubricella sp.]